MDVSEEDLVHPVHLLDSDWLAFQRMAYRDQSALPPNAAACGDCAHVEGTRVLDGSESTWELCIRFTEPCSGQAP